MTAPLWVFGYGSLLWNPGFTVAEARLARLPGWRRSFCMASIHHRGTEAAPGLVLALDASTDAVCTGLALRVAPGEEAQALIDLRARELVSSAYLETRQTVELEDGRPLEEVLAYVIDPAHPQYRGDLDLETQARIIARARGGRGPNDEYLFNTAEKLAELGVADAEMEHLVGLVRGVAAQRR